MLSNFTRLGAYIVMAWLIGIALSLATQGRYFDIAVRDLLISVAAFSLAKLSEVREAALGIEFRDQPVVAIPAPLSELCFVPRYRAPRPTRAAS